MWLKLTWKCENCKWPIPCSTSIFSGSTWPNVKSKVSFEILRTSRFQNCPYFWNLMKIWCRYWWNTKVELFCGHGVDLTIYIIDGKLETDNFAKDIPIFLSRKSCHPTFVFKSVVKSCGIRLNQNCSTDKFFLEKEEWICKILLCQLL